MQCECEINICALAGMGDQQTAALRVLSGVGGLSERGIAGVPGIEEGMAALLDPAFKVGLGDGVGRGEQGIGWVEELDGSLLVDDALRGAAHGERKRGREVAALVLDDEGSAAMDKVVQPRLGGG